MKIILKIVLWLLTAALLVYGGLYLYIDLHKKKIIRIATEKTENYLNGNVEIGSVQLSFLESFPNPSIVFSDVKITDSLFRLHHIPFLTAGKIYLRANVMKLLNNQIQVKGVTIEDARISVYTDSSGYSNDYLFKSRSGQNTAEDRQHIGIRSVILKNTSLSIAQKDRNRNLIVDIASLRTVIKENKKRLLLGIHSDVLIREASFKFSRPNFLKGKAFKSRFELLYDKETQVMKADSVDLDIEGTPLNVSFSIDLNGPSPTFHSKINSGKIFIF